MTATDDNTTVTALEPPPAYLPRSARAHVSASQPTGLAPLGAPPVASHPEH